MIREFLPGMKLSTFGDQTYRTYEELLNREMIAGMVTVVKLDDPFTPDVFEVWERSAQRVSGAGIERWSAIADGIKAISLRRKVDTGDLETLTTEKHEDRLPFN